MRLIWVVAAMVGAFLLTSPAHAATRSFTLANFDSIKVEGDMNVIVETGKSVKAYAEGASELINRLDLRVQNRTLYIRFNKADASRPLRTAQTIPVTVSLAAREVNVIELIGDGNVRIDRLTGRAVQASLYGGGTLTIGDLDAVTMQLNFNGLGGTLTASGRAEDLRAVSRGKGVLDASGLNSETLYVIGEGPVLSQFNATETARVIVSIDAKVRIVGGAKCDVRARKNSEVICEPA